MNGRDAKQAVCPVCMGEGKLWCAMCGTWGNHRSGGCPELVGVGAAADDSRKPSSADETAFAVQLDGLIDELASELGAAGEEPTGAHERQDERVKTQPEEPCGASSLQPVVRSRSNYDPAPLADEAGSGGSGRSFGIIYADPPWQYDFAETDSRKIENHYPTMNLAEICCMEVPAAKNCALYLWATAPKLLEAVAVIRSWGFSYKTHAMWDKEKIGSGYWFRGQHELLMVATRGKVSPPVPELRISSVIRCTRGQHSRKPDYVRDMIAKWFPDVPRLEMFSRIKRPGWEVFGNQVEHDLLSFAGGGGAEQAGDGNGESESRAGSPSEKLTDSPGKDSQQHQK